MPSQGLTISGLRIIFSFTFCYIQFKMNQSNSRNPDLSEFLLAVMRIERTQKEDSQAIKDEFTELRRAVQDQTAVNRRLLTLLERNEPDPCHSDVASTMSLNSVTRYIRHPRKKVTNPKTSQEEERNASFSWALFTQMIEKHREHMTLPSLSQAEVETKIQHVKKIYPSVILHFKMKYNLSDMLRWSNRLVKSHHRVMAIKLEQEVGSLVPLNYCVAHWGAHLLLSKHWQNVQQGHARNSRDVETAGNTIDSQGIYYTEV